MPEPERVGTLEVHQDMEFQQREWRVQKLGWILMFLFIAAAVAGAFGAGPVSNATAGEQGSAVWVDYERFGRRGGPLTLRIHARPAGSELRVQLDRGYMEAVRVQHVTPEPDATHVAAGELVYIFGVAESGEETAVTFDLQPDHIGPLRGRVEVDGEAVEFRQFIYP